MRQSVLAAFALGIQCLVSAAAVPANPIEFRDGTPTCPGQSATETTLTYGEPLLAYKGLFFGKPPGTGNNELVTSTELATPQETNIPKPNFDTLYMMQCYDLSSEDIEVTIGGVPEDRYWSASFYTPYGENYLNLGAPNNTKPGTYYLTPANSTENVGTLGESGNPKYDGVVYSATTVGFLLFRIVLKDTNEDIDVVTEIQKGFGTSVVDRPGPQMGPSLDARMFLNTSNSEAGHILELTSRFAQTWASLEDQDTTEETKAPEELSAAGISDGEYNPEKCINLDKAYEASNETIANYPYESWLPASNSWFLAEPQDIGKYEDNYAARAFIARWGYLAMTNDYALYPAYERLLSLHTNQSYTLSFSSKPPLEDVGFWSVTMYDEDGFLIKNSLDRYAIGDRSSLQYPNGEPVYGDGSKDAPFDILIQGAEPAANWTSNWLPSPKDTTSFELTLRFYVAKEALIAGDWEYPALNLGPVH